MPGQKSGDKIISNLLFNCLWI